MANHWDEAASAGLRRSLLGPGDIIDDFAWEDHRVNRKVVAICRQPKCGGAMYAAKPHEKEKDATPIRWYVAECSSCGSEIASPNGRTMPGSTAHSRVDRAKWEARQARDNAIKAETDRKRKQAQETEATRP